MKNKTILVSLCCYEADKIQTKELDAHRCWYENTGPDPPLPYISGPREAYTIFTSFLSVSSESSNLCIWPWTSKFSIVPWEP